METLDRPSLPDPATIPYRQLAIRYGAIWGAISIVSSLIGYVTETSPSMPQNSSVTWIYSLIGIGVAVWAITTAIRIDRDQQLGGFIDLGRCIGIGALTGLVSGIIGAIFTFLYMTVINPGFKEQMMDAMQVAWAEQGMTEEQIEMAMSMTSVFNPASMSLMQVVAGALAGLVIGLIAGLFMKRERPMV